MKKLIIFLLAAIFLFGFSCKKKPIGPVSEKPTFTIYGVVVKDMNIQKDIASFAVWRNDTLYNYATVKVGNKNIPNIGSGLYYDTLPYNTFEVNTTYIDSIISSLDTVTITFSFTMPDTFYINPLQGNDSINAGGHSVQLSWTSSANASKYILSLAQDTVTGAGLFKTTVGSTDTTITPEAFRNTADQLVTGDYYTYVVAYNKSFFSYPEIPFALPTNLPTENIGAGVHGTIGAGIIARKANIYVTTAR
ncbi:MAG: hypothetical protein OEV55_00565 [candidate division Zixibacteria bacterium]|nr:hypothetical protein [candidate division Zixibacteria bacterium]